LTLYAPRPLCRSDCPGMGMRDAYKVEISLRDHGYGGLFGIPVPLNAPGNSERAAAWWGAALSLRVFRRCPALPRGLPRSTIGAEGLNFRVRDGTGCFPFAVAAGNFIRLWAGYRWLRPCPGNRTVDARCSAWGWLWCQAARPVSTGQLHPLRGFHFRPINPVVWLGALPG
jgi:hypothetical protein